MLIETLIENVDSALGDGRRKERDGYKTETKVQGKKGKLQACAGMNTCATTLNVQYQPKCIGHEQADENKL